MTADLKKSKEILTATNSACVAVKDGVLLASEERGIRPLLGWMQREERLRGFCVADKVVGKAAALLMVCLGVREVYAKTVSEPAVSVFEKHAIPHWYGEKVSRIANRAGDGLCPMEECCMGIDDPAVAHEALLRQVAIMMQGNTPESPMRNNS